MSARAKMILLVLVAAAVAAVAIGVVLAGGGEEEPAVKPDSSTSAPKEPAADEMPSEVPSNFDEEMPDVAEELCLENPENSPADCKD